MNFDNLNRIYPYMKVGDLKTAIQYCQTEISKLDIPLYNKALSNTFIDQTESIIKWIDAFYETVSSKRKIQSMYFELNEFDINPDRWYCNGFAYELDGGLDDIEWLTDWTHTAERDFTLTGFNDFQTSSIWADFDPANYDSKEFERLMAEEEKNKPACEWFEFLVILKFQELIESTQKEAATRGLPWGKVPIYSTEHGFDVIHRTQF